MYGCRARIGYTSPPITAEVFPYEFYRIAPEGVTLSLATLAVTNNTKAELDQSYARSMTAARAMVEAGVDVIVFGGVPVIFSRGEQNNETIVTGLESALGVRVSTTAAAQEKAAKMLGCKKVVIAHAYDSSQHARQQSYVEARDCEVLGITGWGTVLPKFGSVPRDAALEMGRTLLQPELRLHALRTGAIYAGKYLVFPIAVYAAASVLAPMTLPMAVQVALALLIVIPMGPMIYRLAYEPLAEASTLVLLIVSVGVHFAMVGLGLVMFGAEGSRTDAFSDARFDLGALSVSGQSLWVVAVSVLMIVALYFYFGRTVSGKALRATAVNRLGARLVGIGTTQAGRLAFTLAAALGALCGILIAPLTTVYYESGFLIGLKGFVGAIVGGLVSYPVAALGALLVGLLESYSSFWASAFKEVIVFTLILPVLLWRSLTTKHVEEEE